MASKGRRAPSLKGKNKPGSIRCVTFNIAGFNYDWFHGRREIVLNGLKNLEPDILCLQEAAIRQNGEFYHQGRDIGDVIGLRYSAFAPYGNPIEIMSPEQGGVAVLSRWPILLARNRQLPPGHERPPDSRVALVVSLDTPIGELDVINTHLSWRPSEQQMRLVQAGVIFHDFTPHQWTGPNAKTLLLGDLNATEDEPAVQLLSSRLKDAYRVCHPKDPGFTWVKENPLTSFAFDLPDRRVDYIFCPKEVGVRRSELVLNEFGRLAPSDHYGVMAEIEWSGEH